MGGRPLLERPRGKYESVSAKLGYSPRRVAVQGSSAIWPHGAETAARAPRKIPYHGGAKIHSVGFLTSSNLFSAPLPCCCGGTASSGFLLPAPAGLKL